MIPECYFCDKTTGNCKHPWFPERPCVFTGDEKHGYDCGYFERRDLE